MDINFCIFVGACLLEPWSSLPDSPLSLFSSLFLDLSLWPWRALYRTPRRHGEDVANWIVYITVAAQYIARRSGNPTKQGTWISARLSYAGAGLTDHAGFVCTNEATRCRSEYFTLPLSISLINIAIFPPFFSPFQLRTRHFPKLRRPSFLFVFVYRWEIRLKDTVSLLVSGSFISLGFNKWMKRLWRKVISGRFQKTNEIFPLPETSSIRHHS